MATKPDFSHLPSVSLEALHGPPVESFDGDPSDAVFQVGLWDPAGIAALTTGEFER
jgi:hypothetical protein